MAGVMPAVHGPYAVECPLGHALIPLWGIPILVKRYIYVAEVLKMMHQVQLAQAIGNIRRKAIVYTDARVRSVNEVLTGIRVVKCNGWTAAFLKRINDLRAIEMRWIRKASFLRASTATLRVKWNPNPKPSQEWIILCFGCLELIISTKFKNKHHQVGRWVWSGHCFPTSPLLLGC